MNIGILACESLLEYVWAAQKKLGTDYPVFTLDYSRQEDTVHAVVDGDEADVGIGKDHLGVHTDLQIISAQP